MTSFVASQSSTEILGAGGVFKGPWRDVSESISVVTAVKSDQDGTLYMEFTNDTSNDTAKSSLSYTVTANINEVHKLTITRPFYRTRYVNGSTPQTSFEISTSIGDHHPLTAPANLPTSLDSDAILTRVIDAEMDIAEGKRSGYEIIDKFGRNDDIDAGTVPEDVWAGGGVYTGFPTGAAELVTVTSSDPADTSAGSGARTVQIYGLDATGVEQSETVILAGTGLVDSANTYFRVNRAVVRTSGSSNQAFNAGIISVAHKTTTANIFVKVPIGTNQSQVACYTVPLGKTAYLRNLMVEPEKSASTNVRGAVWIRKLGESPRLIRIFTASSSDEHTEDIFGGIVLPALTDVAIRITYASTTNVVVTASFDMLLVTNS